jgi:small subunit ribosomal protein S16
MLVIKLFRVGKKNQPSFKIVVTKKGSPTKGGRFVEQIGFYNPVTKEKVLNQERIKYWISVGAQPSPTTHNLFVSAKIIDEKKIDVHKKPKKKEEEKKAAAPKAAAAPAEAKKEEKPAEEAKKEEAKEAPKEEKKEAQKEEKPAEPTPSA